MFSSSCALPSPASAESCLPLFGRFTGTTAQSDFSSTCMSAVRFMALRGPAFAYSRRRAGDLPVLVHVVSQRARALRLRRTEPPLAITRLSVLPSSYSEGSRHPDLPAFQSSITPPTDASGLRFETHLAMGPARLEVRMESLSPFPKGSCIPYNMPVYPGALRIADNTPSWQLG